MADDWNEAIAEAYASAPADQFVLSTLEILHAAFVDDESPANAASIRIALDERDWNVELEAAAPLHAGQTVLFEALALRVIMPQQEEGRFGAMKIAFDFVPAKYLVHLERAATIRSPAKLIYREWIAVKSGSPSEYVASGPPDFILGELTVKIVDVHTMSIEGEATFIDLLNKTYPRRKFSREGFPGIFGGDVD